MQKRTFAWIIAVILAFILGFLLACWLMRRHPVAPPVCPQTAASTAAAQPANKGAGAMHGGGAKGTGSPVKLGAKGGGDGSLSGSGAPTTGDGAGPPPGGGGNGDGELQGGGANSGNGKTVANGTPGTASGGTGNGTLDAGGGDGKMPSGDVQSSSQSATSAKPPNGAQAVAASPGGAMELGPPDSDLGVDTSRPADKIVAALDYRYDKSGLPHYPNAVRVASSTDAAAAAAAAGPNTKNFSVTEIITDDTPDVVAAWYHKNLPASWRELSMPSAAALDQMSRQAKTPQPGESPVDTMLYTMIAGPQLERSKPGIDAARTAGLTIFEPADQAVDQRMIIVIKDSKTGKTGVLLMKKAPQS